MYGYSITINSKTPALDGDICYENIVCSNQMINKFEQDKLFADIDDYIVILDGVILNRLELINKSNQGEDSSWLNTIVGLYKEQGDCFFSKLRGSYSGAIYDKSKKKWIIFGDHLGSKFTYYARVGDFFCCSQVMGHMYEMMKDNGVNYHLSIENAMFLLTYGFMIDDRTICEEVHKINPGCYITIQDGKLQEHRFYLLDNSPKPLKDDNEAIEMVDSLFRQAIKRQFEKDKEYGYNHIVALSGGLDCRMTSFVAHDMGYTDQLNVTFSQTGYWDQTIPMKIASDLKHEWLFKALDNGVWLYNVDKITRTTGGNVLYYGTAHGDSLLKYINFEGLGLMHSGQLGDVIIGSWVKSREEQQQKYRVGEGAYSKKYIEYLDLIKPSLDLNKELGLFYYRGLNGTNNGLQNTYNYTESLSPFCDIEFFENILSIPVALRQGHSLYKKWILTKYPQAANYVWETTGVRIDAPMVTIKGKSVPLSLIPSRIGGRIKSSIGIHKDNLNSLKHMNPVSYYINNNNELRSYLFDYFKYTDSIENKELREVLQDIKEKGTGMEIIQAVSLLAVIKLFF